MSRRLLPILQKKSLSTDHCVDNSADESETSIRANNSWRARFSGWRGGIVVCIAISALVLLFNIILAIIAPLCWQPKDGIATAFTGDCASAARWTIAIHLIINLLSSLLLGASNYCMQRLAAPTREEVDKAHKQRIWLDIGIPSIKNLSWIGLRRLTLWILLALSSIPLHFLYNSVIFETTGVNYVYFLKVKEEFFTNKSSWNLKYVPPAAANDITRLQDILLNDKYLDRTTFENLTATDCKARYTGQFIRSGPGFGIPTLHWQQLMAPDNSLGGITQGAGHLDVGSLYLNNTFYEADIAYCLSQKIPPNCNIQLSQTILNVVIACNVIKFGTMLFILWRLGQEVTIVTVGDAIKSFLLAPDTTTKNCCMMSRWTVEWLWKVPRSVTLSQAYKAQGRARWTIACSKRRWIMSLFLYFGAITTAATLLAISQGGRGSSIFDGFGKVSLDYLINIDLPYSGTSIIPLILLANLPQTITSFVYLTYNAQFTTMLAHREWSNFAVKRAPLRVTTPSSNQRSTYYLQLPYVFSVPLLLASVILHWLISQSIFLVRIATYKDGNLVPLDMVDQKGTYFSAVGYSTSAIIASIIWGSALVAVIVVAARFATYSEGLPAGGTNSAVISAACHVRTQERRKGDVSDRPLKWGVTIAASKKSAGHCSFSSGEVESPKIGHFYAGY